MNIKGVVAKNQYSFDAQAKTITFSNAYAGMNLEHIMYITNIKSGVATVIYDPGTAAKGGTWDANNLILTLVFNTTLMDNSDPLQIIVGYEGQDKVDTTGSNIVDLVQNISDNLDFLNLSLDQSEGVQVNTREVNPAKRDANNAQVISDGVQYTKVLSIIGDNIVIDASGYGSAEITSVGLVSTTNIAISAEVSADQSFWGTPPGMDYVSPTLVSQSGYTITGTNTRRVQVSIPSRYLRVRASFATAGAVSVVVTLKQAPFPTGPLTQIPVNANITQYNGTGLATAQQVDAAGNLASAGIFAIGSSYVGTTNRPNAASTLATGVPYPISIGGREQPYIGALAGIFRHITVDGGGRYILGGDTPETETRTISKLASGAIPGLPPRGIGAKPNTMQGSQALIVEDVGQAEGDTNTMLLKQILQELKILNQQITELPMIVNTPSYTMSDPQEYRDDKSTLF